MPAIAAAVKRDIAATSASPEAGPQQVGEMHVERGDNAVGYQYSLKGNPASYQTGGTDRFATFVAPSAAIIYRGDGPRPQVFDPINSPTEEEIHRALPGLTPAAGAQNTSRGEVLFTRPGIKGSFTLREHWAIAWLDLEAVNPEQKTFRRKSHRAGELTASFSGMYSLRYKGDNIVIHYTGGMHTVRANGQTVESVPLPAQTLQKGYWDLTAPARQGALASNASMRRNAPPVPSQSPLVLPGLPARKDAPAAVTGKPSAPKPPQTAAPEFKPPVTAPAVIVPPITAPPKGPITAPLAAPQPRPAASQSLNADVDAPKMPSAVEWTFAAARKKSAQQIFVRRPHEVSSYNSSPEEEEIV